jgi:hypothetical protein
MVENKTLQILSNFEIFKGLTEDDLRKTMQIVKDYNSKRRIY